MSEAVRGYWSDTCNSKAMAKAAAKAIREIYAVGQKKMGKAKKGEDSETTDGTKRFISIAASDFWGDGQWLRYKEERMKGAN